MIQARVTFDISRQLEQLRKLGPGLYTTLQRAMWSFVNFVTSDIVQNKLSGQVLNRRTGNLQRHVSAGANVIARGDHIIGAVGVSRLSYGVYHEEGYEGPVTRYAHERRAHARREHWRSGGTLYAGDRVQVRAQQVRAHHVREHEAHVNVRAKWFVRDTLSADVAVGDERIRRALDYLATHGHPPRMSEIRRSA